METRWIVFGIWYIIGLFCQYHIIVGEDEEVTLEDAAWILASATFGPTLFIFINLGDGGDRVIYRRKPKRRNK